jgi:hypothetical protein
MDIGTNTGPYVAAPTDPITGFHWCHAGGQPATLPELVADPAQPIAPLLHAHLDAVDQVLISAAGRFGEVLGGGRAPTDDEREQLGRFHPALDRMVDEYCAALTTTATLPDIRGGQIVGTAHLLGYRTRTVLGVAGPVPLDGALDAPAPGMVAGYAEMAEVDPDDPARGARWIVRTQDDRRLPARLDMLLRDSSGVDRKLTQDTHRRALRAAVDGVGGSRVAADEAAGAVDWLLYDWLHANRDDPSSVAVQITKGRVDDAHMIVRAAETSIQLRTARDPHPMGGTP